MLSRSASLQMEALHHLLYFTEPSKINANNFELKHRLISIVQQNQYSGSSINDPNVHLPQFLEICNTIKLNGVPDDVIRLCLFPFSLRDMAKSWYQILQFGSNTRWEEVTQKFFLKYYPLDLTLKLKIEIIQFEQMDKETFYKAWERYKDKLRKCMSHGFEKDT